MLVCAVSERCARFRADVGAIAIIFCICWPGGSANFQNLALDISGQDLCTEPVGDVYWLIGTVNHVQPGRAFVFSGPPVYKLQRKITVYVSALAPRFEGGGTGSFDATRDCAVGGGWAMQSLGNNANIAAGSDTRRHCGYVQRARGERRCCQARRYYW